MNPRSSHHLIAFDSEWVVSKVCAFTHPLVVVKSYAGFSFFFSDFSDEGLTDVGLFDIPPRTRHQLAEPAYPTRRMGIADDDAWAENRQARKIHGLDRCFLQAHYAGIFYPAARVSADCRKQAELRHTALAHAASKTADHADFQLLELLFGPLRGSAAYTHAADGRHAIAPADDLPRQIGNTH